MIPCTEPATPAVIVFCEFPVLLQEAVLGVKTLTLITVLLERGEGFFRQLQVEWFPHFGKEQIKRRKTAQAIFRQTQTDASRLRRTDSQPCQRDPVSGLGHVDKVFPLPNFLVGSAKMLAMVYI